MNGILPLLGWFIFAILLASACARPIPPGGVSPLYYLFILIVPFAAFCAAAQIRRRFVILTYGIVSGFLFACGVFMDGNVGLDIVYGHQTVLGLYAKVLSFSGILAVVCVLAYEGGVRRLRGETKSEPCTGGNAAPPRASV